jgi:hypothetical protein
MRLVLHIGTRKTGTSTIQLYFSVHRESHLASGVLYPEAGRLTGPRGRGCHAHYELAWSLARPDRRRAVWGALRAEMDRTRATCTVVSAETFASLPADRVRLLREETEGLDVRVVVVLRDRIDFLISEYKQQIKKGATTSDFVEFARQNLDLCDYAGMLRPWSDAFGEDRLRVLDWSRVQRRGVLQAFMEAASLDELPLVGPARTANRSPGDQTSRSMLLINRVERALHLPARPTSLFRTALRRNPLLARTFHAFTYPATRGPLVSEPEKEQVRRMVARFESVTC